MASRTAEEVYSTAVNSLNYITENFKHIEREDIVDKMLIPTFTSCMFKGFFGYITEMIGNNNPNFLEFARLVSGESFHYLISTITSLGASGISIRRIRDEKPHTYFTAALMILMTREKNVYCGDSLMQDMKNFLLLLI